MSEQQPRPGSPGVPLAATGEWIAAARASETRRPTGSWTTPGPPHWPHPMAKTGCRSEPGSPALTDMIIRARSSTTSYGGSPAPAGSGQVVLLAAGLDTRGYRLSWPDQVQMFELDQPAVLEFKQEILDGARAKPRCARRAVCADLTGRWTTALLDAASIPGHCPAGWRRDSCSTCPPNGSPASWTR